MSVSDEAIGRKVQVLRDNLSQQWVADEMRKRGYKWAQATVWCVEKGERPLRLSEAVELADLLHIPIQSLLPGNDVAPAVDPRIAALEMAQDLIAENLNRICGDKET